MNKKTRYIATAIIAIIGLSLVSIPVVTALEYVEIWANGKARGSTKVVHGNKLVGDISSNVLIKVEIYNEGRMIYNKRDNEHHFGTDHFDKPLKGGDLSITVTNTRSERIGVNYDLNIGRHAIFLSPVEKS